jgi:hypothetical protein
MRYESSSGSVRETTLASLRDYKLIQAPDQLIESISDSTSTTPVGSLLWAYD